MNARKVLLWAAIVLVAVMLMVPGPTLAKSSRIFCSGVEESLEVLEFGEWTELPNGRIRVRGMVELFQETSEDCAELNGMNTVTINANWDANFIGPMHGTFWLATDLGDWEGTWQGQTSAEGSSYTAVGHGVSDAVEGLKLWVSATNGVSTAEILNPRGG